jgi:hypothetical protein
MATPEKPSGVSSPARLNPAIASTSVQILEPLRRHSQDAPGGLSGCLWDAFKAPEMILRRSLSNMITGKLAGDTAPQFL